MYENQVQLIKDYFDKFSGRYKVSTGYNYFEAYNKFFSPKGFHETFKFIIDKNYDNHFYLEIDVTDNRESLSFFSDFKVKSINLNHKFCISSTTSNELDECFNFLNYYFKYRPVILDIERIAVENSELNGKRKIIMFNDIINTLRPKNILIHKFPPTNKETIEESLQKIRKLITPYYNFLKKKLNDNLLFVAKHFFLEFTQGELFPFQVKLINHEQRSLNLFLKIIGIHFVLYPDVLNLDVNDIKTQFFFSLLFHYNLQDKLCIEIQKRVLEAITKEI